MHHKKQIIINSLNKIIPALIVLFLSIPCATAIHPSKLIFNKLTSSDGLSQNTIKAIHQDRKGFMWFGTGNGLSRYDGYEFIKYYHDIENKNTISNHHVTDIDEDKNGVLWIATQQGLNKYNPLKGEFTRIYCDPDNINNLRNKIGSIYVDGDILWVGTFEGLFKLNIHTNHIQQITTVKTDKKLEVVDIIKSSEGDLWLAANTQGIIRYTPKQDISQQFYISEDQTEDINKVKDIVIYNDILLLGTYGGLIEFEIKEQRYNRVLLDNNEKFIRIISLLKNKNILWIGTNSISLYYYHLQDKTVYKFPYNSHDPYGLSSNMIATTYLDQNNTLWIGTLSHGIYYADLDQKFTIYRNIPGNSNSLIDSTNTVYHAYEDILGRYWFATTKGISIYNPKTLSYKNFPLGVIFRIYESPDGKIWLAGNHSIYQYEKNTDSFVKEERLTIHSIGDLYQSDNNVLIIGTFTGLVYWDYLNSRKRRIKPQKGLNPELENNDYTLLLEKTNNELLLSGQSGLHMLNLDNYTIQELPEGKLKQELASADISYIYKDYDDNIWVTTANKGIYQFDQDFNILGHISRKHGLIDNAVWALSVIGENIWASTDYGIVKIYKKNNSYKVKTYKEQFFNQEFNGSSVYKTKKNTLIFGGVEGALEFKPSLYEDDHQNLIVQLTDFQLFSKSITAGSELLPQSISYTHSIKLNHQQNLISFKFSALNYKNTDLYYAYQLSGLPNTDWVITDYKNRNITLTALPAGKYTLKLKATNSLQNWNTKETLLNIHILPPWWKTPTAYFVYITTILILIQILIKLRTYNLVQQSRELEKIIQQRTEEVRSKSETIERLMSKKNEVFANISHELRTPITLIKGPICQAVKVMKNRTELLPFQKELKSLALAEKNAERLSLLVDQLLQLSRHDFLSDGHKQIQSLSQIADTITESFQEMSKSQQLQFYTDIEPDIFVSALPNALDTILINLLSNAFKYASPGGSVQLTITANESKVLISVKDTGIGIPQDKLNSIFDRFVRVNSQVKEKVSGAGVGLALVKQQVDLHCGHIDVDSTVGQGSEFKVELFCTKNNELSNDQVIDYVKSQKQEKSLHKDSVRHLHYLRTQLNHNKSQKITISPDNNLENLEKAKLLIIDDTDDMRQYLESLLSTHYLCLMAANGESGLSIAIKEIPDIVICDVMMPGISGFDVLDKLRQDIRTSHIPILLLTAKNDKDSKLQGLSKLADDYITKPFDAEELITRLQSILQIRQLQQQKLQQLIIKDNIEKNDWENMDLNPQEQGFLERLNNITEDSYNDEEFNVEQLAQHLNLSERALLYKIKSLLGKSPNEFIREYRLNRAKHLILAEKINIADLAEHVGFGNPSYFHKCFKAYVGCTPKQYIQSHTHH